MAHMYYFRDKIDDSLKKEKAEKIISWLRENSFKDKYIIFSLKGKFGRWEELAFFPIRGQGIGIKRIIYFGSETITLFETKNMLDENFFNDIKNYKELFNIFENATLIQFLEMDYSTNEWTVNFEEKITGIENDKSKTDYDIRDSIEDFSPEEIFSWIQTYAKSENEELKEIYFKKLQKLFLNN